ncbi:Agglutinin HPA-like protein [Glarea lozoyensis ATCC 20868]|uniref:Agglutinin HPA-like protein n=1 Tax=Glarea lozoyensis (strain ATCC 20868 / MF5171) TaxID=1116229 RepID=S3D178_GLAL2|nr:Agglutinin HPA-like protein [Glarea lozoyensis ATCC 20868]EPE32267.1 Agglutinin HPA-like protein [Glarea lozoyensis ATCC 20868]
MPPPMSPAVLTTDKTPLLFCSPGDPSICSDTVESSLTGQNTLDLPNLWPQGTHLRVKILQPQHVHPGVKRIIEDAVKTWSSSLSESINVQWVQSHESAEIRISITNDAPNWSALGAKASEIQDQNQATMNVTLDGWMNQKIDDIQLYISRVTAHLFGHALGLPHPSIKFSSPWNFTELENHCGSFFATVVMSSNGYPGLLNPLSIMAFDRPGILGSGVNEHHGGLIVDSEALDLLRRLYPAYNIFCPSIGVVCTQTLKFKGGIHVQPATQRFLTQKTANVITGISYIDMGLHGNFRLTSYPHEIQKGSSFDVTLGSWHDTHIYDAKCSVMSFAEEDPRILTGSVESAELRGGKLNCSTYVYFRRPFRQTPNVVAWVSGFDFAKDKNLRIEVSVDEVSNLGFRLRMNTWLDSTAYNIRATWLAHEQDQYDIRSGTFETPHHGLIHTREDKLRVGYTSPMRKKPSKMFAAFTYIDVETKTNIRLETRIEGWNERSAEGWFSTWERESRFFCLRGCYIAVL